jgi:hypothetical protein
LIHQNLQGWCHAEYQPKTNKIHSIHSLCFTFSHHFYTTMRPLSILARLVFGTIIIASTACQNSTQPTTQTKAPLQIPSAYNTSGIATNAATETALMANLHALTTEMQNGRPGAATATNRNLTVSADKLRMLFTQSPSLSDFTTTYYRDLITRPNAWIDQLAAASGKDGNLTAMPPTAGRFGGSSGYLFNQFGHEPEQAIEKGLFGAATFNKISELFDGTVSAAILDRALTLYGAPTNFPNGRPAAGASNNNDVALAQYAARRDNSSGGVGGNTGAQGYYTLTRDAFIKAQAAIAAGAVYKPELDSALRTIRENMERVIAATCINYCHAAIAALSATNPTDAQIAAALHALSENTGFIGGLKTVPRKIITDAQIDTILAALNAPHGQNAAMTRFINNPTELAKLTTIITDLARIYSFTPAQIELFKRNNLTDRP